MYKIFTSFVENNQLIDESFTMNYIKSELNNKNLFWRNFFNHGEI